MSGWKHRISDVNEEDRTGTCSNCGEVALYRKATRWQCRVQRVEQKRIEQRRKTLRQNPNAKRRNGNPEANWYYKNDDGSATIVSNAERNVWLAEANGICAICQKATQRLALDHCHATGKVRGVLCFSCNTGLGKFKDDIAALQMAIEYLQK